VSVTAIKPRRQTQPSALPARRTYTLDEVSQMLGLSRNATYVAAREDRLPFRVIRIGKRMMVSRAVFDRFLDGK
jgi:predicted DNA-binding transcriptional regulator AlpA